MRTPATILLAACLAGCGTVPVTRPSNDPVDDGAAVGSLGAFSVSLAVKDLAASQAFYEQLGFAPRGGNAAQNWLILANGNAVIGLFQGMFEGNILTFNPGWDQATRPLADFTDVRDVQATLEAGGLRLTTRADEATTGPASLTLVDPDGNMILIDQHVPRSPTKTR